MKICSKCKKEKFLSEFGKDNSRKEGLKYNCKSCAQNIHTKSRNKNKEYYQQKNKEYYQSNKEYLNQLNKSWLKSNLEKYKKYRKKWLENNPGYESNFHKTKRKTDPQFRIKNNLRERMRKALKGNWKKGKTIDLLGCTIEEYKIYLEKQFDKNMTWGNYGIYWEVDHIKPCDYFDLTNLEEQKECFIFTNTRPLLIYENRKKSNKLI
jgi:DNA-directed RNA polymerase subunit RPC12/RpoP